MNFNEISLFGFTPKEIIYVGLVSFALDYANLNLWDEILPLIPGVVEIPAERALHIHQKSRDGIQSGSRPGLGDTDSPEDQKEEYRRCIFPEDKIKYPFIEAIEDGRKVTIKLKDGYGKAWKPYDVRYKNEQSNDSFIIYVYCKDVKEARKRMTTIQEITYHDKNGVSNAAFGDMNAEKLSKMNSIIKIKPVKDPSVNKAFGSKDNWDKIFKKFRKCVDERIHMVAIMLDVEPCLETQQDQATINLNYRLQGIPIIVSIDPKNGKYIVKLNACHESAKDYDQCTAEQFLKNIKRIHWEETEDGKNKEDDFFHPWQYDKRFNNWIAHDIENYTDPYGISTEHWRHILRVEVIRDQFIWDKEMIWHIYKRNEGPNNFGVWNHKGEKDEGYRNVDDIVKKVRNDQSWYLKIVYKNTDDETDYNLKNLRKIYWRTGSKRPTMMPGSWKVVKRDQCYPGNWCEIWDNDEGNEWIPNPHLILRPKKDPCEDNDSMMKEIVAAQKPTIVVNHPEFRETYFTDDGAIKYKTMELRCIRSDTINFGTNKWDPTTWCDDMKIGILVCVENIKYTIEDDELVDRILFLNYGNKSIPLGDQTMKKNISFKFIKNLREFVEAKWVSCVKDSLQWDKIALWAAVGTAVVAGAALYVGVQCATMGQAGRRRLLELPSPQPSSVPLALPAPKVLALPAPKVLALPAPCF